MNRFLSIVTRSISKFRSKIFWFFRTLRRIHLTKSAFRVTLNTSFNLTDMFRSIGTAQRARHLLKAASVTPLEYHRLADNLYSKVKRLGGTVRIRQQSYPHPEHFYCSGCVFYHPLGGQ